MSVGNHHLVERRSPAPQLFRNYPEFARAKAFTGADRLEITQ
jgi:hypothetical protein